MPQLSLANGYKQTLPGLGRYQAFDTLSEKRITKCVREALRKRFGFSAVTVSCSAEFDGREWRRACTSAGNPLGYRISAAQENAS